MYPDPDKIVGALVGGAIGNALAAPVDGMTHDYIRMFYGGIKAYRDDERRRDLAAGQWSWPCQMTFALADALVDGRDGAADRFRGSLKGLLPFARRWSDAQVRAVEDESSLNPRPNAEPATIVAPLGVLAAAAGLTLDELVNVVCSELWSLNPSSEALAAASLQAFALQYVLTQPFERRSFWLALTEAAEKTGAAQALVSTLSGIEPYLNDFPLDLRDRCGRCAGAFNESVPFALAMFTRNPNLIEGTLLSTINAGGDAVAHGTMVGTLLGAYHGFLALPQEWVLGLEDGSELQRVAGRFATAVNLR